MLLLLLQLQPALAWTSAQTATTPTKLLQGPPVHRRPLHRAVPVAIQEAVIVATQDTRTTELESVNNNDKPRSTSRTLRSSLIACAATALALGFTQSASAQVTWIRPYTRRLVSLYHSLVKSLNSLNPLLQTLLNHKFKSFTVIWLFYSLQHSFRVRLRQSKDPTSEWGRYANYPGARGRALVWLVAGQIIPMYGLARLVPNASLRDKLFKYSGRRLANGLLQLGPLYIKLGQIISSREALLPSQWVKSLERLQDQVPAQSGDKAVELAYAAYGKEAWLNTFSTFDTTPLAAASLGQVHSATLLNNTQVAVKLQRPYLRQIYNQDLQLLTSIAKSVDKYQRRFKRGGMEQSWTAIFADAEAILYREIDYRDEAENGVRFLQEFGLTAGGKSVVPTALAQNGQPMPSAAGWLRAPFVYRDLCTEKVLVMEYVPSIKITNLQKLAQAQVSLAEKEYLAECLARAYLRQFCCHLFFSADPHPGNLGVEILSTDTRLPPSQRVRLVFYDFGQAATLTENQARGILDIIEAIVDLNVEKSIRSFETMGVLKPDADREAVYNKVAENFRTGKVKANRKRLTKRGYKMKEIDMTTVTPVVVPTMKQDKNDAQVMQYFTLPAEYAFVGRALSQMGGVGLALDPEFDFISASAPWIVEIKGAGQYLKDEANKFLRNWFQGFQNIFPKYV
jgi:predicted unusual protein kinase regulating ubiquinone biosynthesis (AarF/ABC1/UbiB family)